MSGAKRTFELIQDEAPAAPPPDDQQAAARQLLFTALRALSQRTLTAITNGFSLILVGLVFILFGRILDDPTPYKLGAVGGFAAFCLLLDIVRRKS